MLSSNSNSDMMKIATNKSLLKEYSTSSNPRTVYLNDKTEFQIQLFNPKSDDISARVYIDGHQLSNDIILRPGERLWLERYLDKPKKFLFETYSVDGGDSAVQDAIRKNGVIEVRFFDRVRRKSCNNSLDWINSTYSPIYNSNYTIKGVDYTIEPSCTCYNSTVASGSFDSSVSSNCLSELGTVSSSLCSNTLKSQTIETGRVGEGGHSNQTFETVDAEFSYLSFKTETIKILPLSQKPTYSDDLKKKYCPWCGAKVKDNFKYCPRCGKEL